MPKKKKKKARTDTQRNRKIAVAILRELLPSTRNKVIHWGGKAYRP